MTPKEIANYLITNRRALRTRRGLACPVCGHMDSHCLRMPDDSAALCPKTDGSGSVKRYGEYGYLYLLQAESLTGDVGMLPRVEKVKERSDVELHAIWAPRVEFWQRGVGLRCFRLASTLGVSSESLRQLSVGWDGKAWTFPERNADGLIIGVNRRFEDGAKRCATGSRRGLTYSLRWSTAPGPVLLVEGGSDTAAGITLGLSVIGRPSNTGGVAILVALLKKYPERQVIVIGERDKKPDGRWPGMEGGKAVSMALVKRVGARVGCRLLPDGAKDLRAWWQGTGAAITAAPDEGRRLLNSFGWKGRRGYAARIEKAAATECVGEDVAEDPGF